MGPVSARTAPAPGAMAVDVEERVNFRRLHDYRLARARKALAPSGLGALLCFDCNNIRYLTSTAIGEWTRDKLCRYALLAGEAEPVVWDFGSAATYHRLHSPWLAPENSRAAYASMRGAVGPEAGISGLAVDEIVETLRRAGVADMPVGIDLIDIPLLFSLQEAGIEVRDGQQVMLEARSLKSSDEVTLLATAAAMVDGAYQKVAEALRPGVRENEIVALVNDTLYRMGSDDVESVNAVSGERCVPHPHNFSDRLIRPGEQAFFDIMHSFNGYRTCYYRCFSVGYSTPAQRDAYKRAREWMDRSIELVRPGATTDQLAASWPTAQEIGLTSEKEAFGLQFGHGLGLALHERPLISRLNSLEHPIEIETGMVFALETYCPATDGRSAARIEEEIVVTEEGPQVITLFPAEELFVANAY